MARVQKFIPSRGESDDLVRNSINGVCPGSILGMIDRVNPLLGGGKQTLCLHSWPDVSKSLNINSEESKVLLEKNAFSKNELGIEYPNKRVLSLLVCIFRSKNWDALIFGVEKREGKENWS